MLIFFYCPDEEEDLGEVVRDHYKVGFVFQWAYETVVGQNEVRKDEKDCAECENKGSLNGGEVHHRADHSAVECAGELHWQGLYAKDHGKNCHGENQCTFYNLSWKEEFIVHLARRKHKINDVAHVGRCEGEELWKEHVHVAEEVAGKGKKEAERHRNRHVKPRHESKDARCYTLFVFKSD